MMGLDLKLFGPQFERCVAALESMAVSFKEMAETAKRQREVLDKHYQLLAQPTDTVVNNSLHLVDDPTKGRRGRG